MPDWLRKRGVLQHAAGIATRSADPASLDDICRQPPSPRPNSASTRPPNMPIPMIKHAADVTLNTLLRNSRSGSNASSPIHRSATPNPMRPAAAKA
jgi:hypothetical protein